MRKLNNKGYMLVEIIMAFAITFALIYFLMDLVINLKNKNDDLLVDTILKTDQTIISNKLLEHIIEDTSDEENVTFSCDKIKVNEEKNTVIYDVNGDDLGGDDDSILGIIDDSATISYDPNEGKGQCSNKNGRIHINIPVVVKQMPDKNYNIVVDYRYKLIYCNPNKSYKCKDSDGNWKTVGEEPYAFEYDGYCEVIDDGDDNWRIKFLEVGNRKFVSNCDMIIDAFLVGGGGAGSSGDGDKIGGGGGGGGYTSNTTFSLTSGKEYDIVIGGGGKNGGNGENTIAFGSYAHGGYGANGIYGGGSGGSCGGGSGGQHEYVIDGTSGCSDGKNKKGNNGTSQGSTTCEFGESPCEKDKLYAGGGGGGAYGASPGLGGIGGGGGGANLNKAASNGTINTGGGGGGGAARQYTTNRGPAAGGSGIVVIRNSSKKIELDFTYKDGYYNYIDDGNGNWRIKFLTDGIFIPNEDIIIDAFLVGGGGGGGDDDEKNGGGGGGGGYTSNTTVSLKSGKEYIIIIGDGGEPGLDGEDTIAFKSYAHGGFAAYQNLGGGSGGSCGGGGALNDYALHVSTGGCSDGVRKLGNVGTSQESTTREFGEPSGDLYSGGGGGGAGYNYYGSGGGDGGGGNGSYSRHLVPGRGAVNSGGGGGGAGARSGNGGSGGSGIVVIRNSSKKIELDFTYKDGYYNYIDDGGGKWRIKFLTSGKFISNDNVNIDAFLVGGGGGGAANDGDKIGGSGGGGGEIRNVSVSLESGKEYDIIVGEGGEPGLDGVTTSGFGSTAKGGTGGTLKTAGSGGSGGGGGGSHGLNGANGGSAGSNGFASYGVAGTGQGSSTYEFGDPNLKLYAGGGGGGFGFEKETFGGSGGAGGGGNGSYKLYARAGRGAVNSGGGGGGAGARSGNGGAGGSGIVVIRKKR